MKAIVIFASILLIAGLARTDDIDLKQLRCMVCRTTIEEVEGVLEAVDPKQEIEIGNFRLDGQGNIIRKKVSLAQSEVYISEVLDDVCEKMNDYVRARYKSNGQLTILKLVSADGQMNPDMSKVDIIQDGDLNKSLKHFCDDLVEEYDESIVELFRKGDSDIINSICTKETNICKDELPADEGDYNDETFENDDISFDRTEL